MTSVLLKRSQIPVDAREKFIFGGYRPTTNSMKTCIISAFKIHNETLNIWTHFLPVVYFIYILVCDDVTGRWKNMELGNGIYKLVLYIYLAGILTLFSTSSFAHIFHCLSPRWRHICFMMDYAAISIYGTTSAVAYYYFVMPRPITLWVMRIIYSKEEVYLTASVASALIAMLLCCWTRINQSPLCNVIRTTAYALPFCIGSVPAFMRCVRELIVFLQQISLIVFLQWIASFFSTSFIQSNDADRMQNTTDHVQQNENSDDGASSLEFTIPYLLHVLYLVTAAAFKMSHIPERWWPGKFDVYGHSHQWFHVFIFLGIREQFWIIMEEISRDKSPIFSQPSISSVFNTWCAIILLLSLLGVILLWFNQSLTPYLEAQDEKYICQCKAQTNSSSVRNQSKDESKCD